MKTNLFKVLLGYMPLCMGLMVLSISCDDDLQVGKRVDESSYTDIYENRVFLRDARLNQSSPVVELYTESYQATVKVCLSKNAVSTTSATLKIDADYLAAYNEEHQTDFKLYPQELVKFAEEGKITFVPGTKNAELGVSIAGGAEVLEGETYALPVAITETSDDLSAADAQSSHCLYLIKDMRNASNAYKGEDAVKGFLFFEVNDVNPLNALSFQLENGKYLWDAVVLFAANINYDSDAGRPFIKCNPNVQYLLDNNETLLQPLRKKGIKVLLGLLGNHDMAGLAQLSKQGAKDFAREVAQYCKAYNLDGVNYDNEYSNYPDLDNPAFTSPGMEAAARLCYETKQAMPDKLVTVFDYSGMYGVSSVDGVDADEWIDVVVPNYGGTAYPIGNMSRKKCAGMAIEFNIGIGSLSEYGAQTIMNGGFGWYMGFAPSPKMYSIVFDKLSGVRAFYGSPLKDPTFFYKKNDPNPSPWPSGMNE